MASSSLQFAVDQVPIRMYAQEPRAGAEKHPAIVLLHGAGGNLDFWTARLAPYLQEAGVALYAPHYFDRTGTGRADLATIQDGVHVAHWLKTVDAAIAFAAARPGVDAQRMVLAGISLGGFLALGFAAQLSADATISQRRRLCAVVEISGGLVEPFLSQATPAFAPTLILHGAQDNIVPPSYAEALDRKLTALNVAHRTEILEGQGHWFTGNAVPRMLLAVSGFLQQHMAPAAATRAM